MRGQTLCSWLLASNSVSVNWKQLERNTCCPWQRLRLCICSNETTKCFDDHSHVWDRCLILHLVCTMLIYLIKKIPWILFSKPFCLTGPETVIQPGLSLSHKIIVRRYLHQSDNGCSCHVDTRVICHCLCSKVHLEQ